MTYRQSLRCLSLLVLSVFSACASSTPAPGTDAGRLVADAGVRDTDGGTRERDDAGADDAGRGPDSLDAGPIDVAPRTYAEVQPILERSCGECHGEDAPFGSSFVSDESVLDDETSAFNSGCVVDDERLSIGACVVETARHQREWGRRCNSQHPGQYHRDYSWPCLTTSEIAEIVAWGGRGR